ncbi:MAG: phosphoribosylglycinamide synthetase C domain-containing protein, partial [Halieaceae bacterium]
GMGAYSPAPVVTDAVRAKVMEQVIWPTVRGMAAEGHPYTGFLYAGLMIDADGNPSVIEYNCRFGDPETQPIMHRLQSDLAALCLAALDRRLDEHTAQWDPRPAVGVVLAAGGYPGSYEKGHPIAGLDTDWPASTKVFHAGTRQDSDAITTQGGRVLCVSALGDSIRDAIDAAYRGVDQISWKDMVVRRDIGWRAIDR